MPNWVNEAVDRWMTKHGTPHPENTSTDPKAASHSRLTLLHHTENRIEKPVAKKLVRRRVRPKMQTERAAMSALL
jgi:hypothetical protein